VPAHSGWTERLRTAWPKAFVHARPDGAAPTLALEADDVDAWLKARSSNFRHQMRRFRRRLTEAGAVWRVTEQPEELATDIAAFEQLHRSRHEWRGGSDAFPPGAEAMLAEAGREFDDEYGQLRPSYVGLVDGVAAAMEAGHERFDLGQGTQHYKYRFADGEDELEVVTVVPPGSRRLIGRAAYAPAQLRHAISSRLSPERKEWIKRKLPGRGGAPGRDEP